MRINFTIRGLKYHTTDPTIVSQSTHLTSLANALKQPTLKHDYEPVFQSCRSFMDVVSASVDPTNLDELVDSMFKIEGGEEKEFLYFEDFGSIMMDLDKKDGLLSDVNNVFKGRLTFLPYNHPVQSQFRFPSFVKLDQ